MARISANKLGEYLIASAPRRRAIIRDQKHPPEVVVARYRAAIDPVRAYFLGGGKDTKAIDAAVVKLRSDRSGTKWVLDDREATARALEVLLKMRDKLFEEGVRYLPAPDRADKLVIAGVEISAQPHFLVVDDRRAPGRVGALKLHFVKTDDAALTQKGAEYVATLLHQWVTTHASRGGRTSAPALSRSVDVFRQAVVAAPTSQVRRLAEISAACEEIGHRWALV